MQNRSEIRKQNFIFHFYSYMGVGKRFKFSKDSINESNRKEERFQISLTSEKRRRYRRSEETAAAAWTEPRAVDGGRRSCRRRGRNGPP